VNGFSEGFNPAYRAATWGGAADGARQRYGQEAQFGMDRRQAGRTANVRRAGIQGQARGNQYSLYSGLGDLSNQAYGNYLDRTGGYRNFAFGALSGLMR